MSHSMFKGDKYSGLRLKLRKGPNGWGHVPEVGKSVHNI